MPPAFEQPCLQPACTKKDGWAYLGPGNWGPDAWLILSSLAGDKVVMYVHSRLRSSIQGMYESGVLKKEAGKCWCISLVKSCLLFITDEEGRGKGNEALDVGSATRVVPVSRHARTTTVGISTTTLKRCREAIVMKERGRTRAKR